MRDHHHLPTLLGHPYILGTLSSDREYGWPSFAMASASLRWEARVVTESNSEKLKAGNWVDLCREYGWVCKLCGTAPQLGKRFADNLCDDCKLQLKNE